MVRILFKPQAMFHRQHKFGRLTGILTHDRDAQIRFRASRFYQTVRCAIGNGAGVINAVPGDFHRAMPLSLASCSLSPTRATSA